MTRSIKFPMVMLALAGSTLLAGCNWHLKTRTPPVSEAAEAPAFALPDHEGNTVTLDRLLARGPAVVVFYRGHW